MQSSILHTWNKTYTFRIDSKKRNAYQLNPQLLEERSGLIQIEGKDKNEIVHTSVPCLCCDVETLLENLLRNRPGQGLELHILDFGLNFCNVIQLIA